jgi:hygromycin-B 4-O-kinase
MSRKNPSPAKKVTKFKELARRVAEHHFGSRPRRVSFNSSGLTNFVFGIKNGDGEFVVRISPDAASLNLFIKEQWAQRAAAGVGVPTAEILEVGSAVIPFPYMIVRSVKGTEATDHPKRSDIIREMGKLAKRINGVRTKGFGATFDWSNNILSRNETWREYLENEYQYESKIETLDRLRLVDASTLKDLRKIFRDAAELKTKPALNHSDLRLKNVICDENGKINAIIDWEKCTSNIAPHWELSLALHDLGIDEKQQFIDGYGLSPKKLAEAADLIKAFNMLNYVPKIETSLAEGDKKELERVRLRLAGTFDLYSL